jgi:CBS domain-containing protein
MLGLLKKQIGNHLDCHGSLMTLHRIKELPRPKWATTRAGQVMLPLEQLKSIDPDAEMWAALQKMDRYGVNQLPVTRDHHVIGMLSREAPRIRNATDITT